MSYNQGSMFLLGDLSDHFLSRKLRPIFFFKKNPQTLTKIVGPIFSIHITYLYTQASSAGSRSINYELKKKNNKDLPEANYAA